MASLRRQLRALQNDPNLAQFIMRDARPTGRQLGVGSYGSVEEIEVNRLVCAGKKIHEALLDAGNIGGENIAQKYVQECQLMSTLRHPNVTLFLGLCFLPPVILPVLLMERLEGNLDDLLESTPNIPLALKQSILEDVARGLLFLHERDPPIIHRDLTAKNVLLTSSFAAKITDLGNSRIVNLQPGQLARTMSQLPGTLSYMPPEALSMASRYGPSLDIFSFGHLGLFTGLQVFPGDLLEHNYPDPHNPERLLGRSEVERRGVHFEQLENSLPRGEQHPFVQLVKQCLHNVPVQRPTAEVLLRRLEEMRAEIEGPYGSYDVMKLDLMRQVAMTRTLRQSESEVRRKDEEIRGLQQVLEQTQMEKANVEERLQNQNTELITQLNQAQVERDGAEERVGRAQEQLEMERAGFVREQTALAQQLQERLLDNATQAQNLKERLTQAQVDRGRAEERVGRVQEQLQQLKMERAGFEETLRVQTAQVQQLEERLTQAQNEVSRLQTDKQGHLQRIEQLEVSRDDLRVKLEAKTIELRNKDAVISRLLRERPTNFTELKAKETSLSEFKPPLKLQWRQGKYMPVAIGQHPHVVVIGRKVYIGGGNSQTVMVYDVDIDGDTMDTLPQCSYEYYGMTAHNSKLILVGGLDPSTRKKTNELCVWDIQYNQWTHPYPPMTIPSSRSCVIVYKRWVIVVRGCGEESKCLSRVELLDTSTGQWYQATPLPEPCVDLTSCVIGNTCFLLGGWVRDTVTPNEQVFTVSLDKLISNAVSPSTGASPSHCQWSTVTDPPHKLSTAVALQGSLLAVGGTKTSDIYAYQPRSSKLKTWVKVGDLPENRDRCGCVVLPNGELFVAGGKNCKKGHYISLPTNTVVIATFI